MIMEWYGMVTVEMGEKVYGNHLLTINCFSPFLMRST